MSETEKFVGKIQLRPRLENETDKDYFERVTGCNWEKYDDSIDEAIYDNNLSYYEAKRGQKGYICLNKNIYEFLELEQRDTEESYCDLEKIQDDTYKFIAQYYNGGCGLGEILEDEMRKNEK